MHFSFSADLFVSENSAVLAGHDEITYYAAFHLDSRSFGVPGPHRTIVALYVKTNLVYYTMTCNYFSVWGNTCNGGTIEYPYTGNVSITDNGRIYQNWSDQTPHPHDFTVEFYVKNEVVVDVTSNYCRQPDFDSEPWCYTREPNVRWEYCGVSVCTGML